ncbi:hypothetical protein AcV5_008837 [Taiwanofungus camphoratus]|nr:hypothetical protein AcV5_008837 [Antrodia cinnamomea]
MVALVPRARLEADLCTITHLINVDDLYQNRDISTPGRALLMEHSIFTLGGFFTSMPRPPASFTSCAFRKTASTYTTVGVNTAMAAPVLIISR